MVLHPKLINYENILLVLLLALNFNRVFFNILNEGVKQNLWQNPFFSLSLSPSHSNYPLSFHFLFAPAILMFQVFVPIYLKIIRMSGSGEKCVMASLACRDSPLLLPLLLLFFLSAPVMEMERNLLAENYVQLHCPARPQRD